ncbi:hypothetical protein [Pseudomonas sp. D3-10]|uniref:hypothetical protein n=1 Tax=Pseudomonas sp. D3-10 TaxID=2817392 RepID=UPI003DA8321B
MPAFFVTVLPPPLALLAVIFLGSLMGLAARLGALTMGRGIARLTVGAVFGLGFSLGRALPEWWGILVAIIAIIVGLACVSKWERRLGLAPVSTKGPSAWGGNEPLLTPEGEPIRVFNHSEIAMGGPVYCDYLFPDGVLLQGIGSSAVFSSEGRYFAAPVPSRQDWGLVILDRQQRTLYRCAESEFWELDAFDSDQLSGRYSPLVDNGVRQVRLEKLLQTAEAVDLIPVADLWLEPGLHPDNLQPTFERPSADGRQCLAGNIILPATLRDLDRPLEPLYSPRYAVSINGQPSGLLMTADAPLVWSTDHRALVCLAGEQANEAQGERYWSWQVDKGWRDLPLPWIKSTTEPSFYWHDLLKLDAGQVHIDAYLDYPRPGSGQYGYRLDSIHSDTETQTGHDIQGRVQVGEFKLTRMAIVIPLDSPGRRGDSHIETQALLGGTSARLSWQGDNREGLGGYRCQIGDWLLPERWLLDHRASDCGRYLALLPFGGATTVATHAVVADVQERRLLKGPAMWVERILDFRDGRLSLAMVVGRLDNDLQSSPLRRFNVAAPEVGSDASFCRPNEQSRLFYNTVQLQPTDSQLNVIPPWRLVDRPQAATADGDFIQPAPTHRDAAWLFGSETEYADSWVRAGTPRLGGYLLTASGCALVDLAPSMIWSSDGHYLALTRMATDVAQLCGSYRGWQLMLLDVQAHTLRIHPRWLGNRPEFEGFDEEKLRVRCFERDWETEDDEDRGAAQSFTLDDLLLLPAEQLIGEDGLWLRPSQAHLAPAWRALALPAISYFERRSL